MAVEFKWHGPQVMKFTLRQLYAGVKAVTLDYHRMCRKAASITNTGRVIKLKQTKRAKAMRKQRKKPGSRIPVFIPGVGWRMSKNRRKSGGIGNKTQITVYPNSSKPNEPVRRRTGVGQKNIVMTYDDQAGIGRVGYTSNARYMMFHELGIRYPRGVQKRPTLVPVLRGNMRRLQIIFTRAAQRTKP